MARSSTEGQSRILRTTSQVVQESDYSFRYERQSLQKPEISSGFGKSSGISFLLLVSAILTATWMSSGFGWIYEESTGSSPIASCPAYISPDSYVDAEYCRVTLSRWSTDLYTQILQNRRFATTEEVAKDKGLCVLPRFDSEVQSFDNDQDAITCYSRSPCSRTTDWVPLNPYSVSALNTFSTKSECSMIVYEMQFTVNCYSVASVDPFCEESFSIKPNEMVAVRGIMISIVVLWLLMLVYDLHLYIKVSGLNRAILAYRLSSLGKRINAERKEMMNRCLLKWNSMSTSSIPIIRSTSSFGSNGSLPQTPTSGSPGWSPRSGAFLPFQPVLTPRTAVAHDVRASPSGYSPRMDSPPVAVVKTINECTSKMNRFNGTVEVLFSTTWRKRVQRYFSMRSKNLALLAIRGSKRFVRSSVLSLIFIATYVLIFRFVAFLISYPAVTQMPAGITLLDLLGLSEGDMTPSSIGGVISDDLSKDNRGRSHYLFFWVEWLAFLDMFVEAFLLIFAAGFSYLRVTDVNKVMLHNSAGSIKILVNQSALEETQLPMDSVSGEGNRFGMPVNDLSESDSPASYLSSPSSRIPAPPLSLPKGIPQLRLPISPASETDEEQSTTSGGSVTCVLMSVMAPCATKEGREDFVAKLKALRDLVDSEQDIFVVDCGRTREPIDNTEFVIYSKVGDKIHYVYFPEPNRVLALYWTSKYWIPFLFASNMCGDYIYSLIVDDSVLFPNNFELPPASYLLRNPKIKALTIPVEERPTGLASTKRMVEQIELTATFNISGTAMHAGSISVPQLWERNTFEMTCFNLKDDQSLPLNRQLDMCMNGRNLLKDRGESVIGVWLCQGGVKPVVDSQTSQYKGYAEDFSIGSNIWELIDPSSFLHKGSLAAKPVVFIELLNVFYDTFRLFLITGMLLRDPLGFTIVAIIAVSVSLLPLLINLAACVRYHDHRMLKLLFLFAIYPVQTILFTVPVRVVELFKHKIIPTLLKKTDNGVSLGEREVEFRDLPIVPPHPVPHWPTVWL